MLYRRHYKTPTKEEPKKKPIPETKEEPVKETQEVDEDLMVHTGSGWYLLPDGKKIQGYDKAIAYLKDLVKGD